MQDDPGAVAPSNNPLIPSAAASLDSWLPHLLGAVRPKVEGKWFFKQVVYLDGYDFVSCRFEQCHLVLREGLFSLVSCRVTECSYYFQNRTVQVVRVFNMADHSSIPQTLMPQWAEDGTVSI